MTVFGAGQKTGNGILGHPTAALAVRCWGSH